MGAAFRVGFGVREEGYDEKMTIRSRVTGG